MPTRANPHRPNTAEQVFIYDPANGIDQRPALLDLIKAPWEFIEGAHSMLVDMQNAGLISKKVMYGAVTKSGYQLRIRRQIAPGAVKWTIKVKQVQKT